MEIDSNEWVRGICIDISPELLAEALASQLRPDTLCPDLNLDRFLTLPTFWIIYTALNKLRLANC